jgi:hypothetical protein
MYRRHVVRRFALRGLRSTQNLGPRLAFCFVTACASGGTATTHSTVQASSIDAPQNCGPSGPDASNVDFVGADHVCVAVLRRALAGAVLSREPEQGDAVPFELPEDVVAALRRPFYELGYLGVSIGPARREAQLGGGGTPRIAITIVEGVRYRLASFRVTELDAQGHPVEPPSERRVLCGGLRTRAGGWFPRATIVGDVERLQRAYADAGYASVDVQTSVTMPASGRADVVLRVQPGTRAWIERVDVTGAADREEEERVIRAAALSAGQLCTRIALDAARSRLEALGRYDMVRITYASVPGSGDRVVVTIALQANPAPTI